MRHPGVRASKPSASTNSAASRPAVDCENSSTSYSRKPHSAVPSSVNEASKSNLADPGSTLMSLTCAPSMRSGEISPSNSDTAAWKIGLRVPSRSGRTTLTMSGNDSALWSTIARISSRVRTTSSANVGLSPNRQRNGRMLAKLPITCSMLEWLRPAVTPPTTMSRCWPRPATQVVNAATSTLYGVAPCRRAMSRNAARSPSPIEIGTRAPRNFPTEGRTKSRGRSISGGAPHS